MTADKLPKISIVEKGCLLIDKKTPKKRMSIRFVCYIPGEQVEISYFEDDLFIGKFCTLVDDAQNILDLCLRIGYATSLRTIPTY